MNEQKICRLCLEIILGNSLESLSKMNLRMLEILRVNLDMGISKNPNICSKCVENLQLSFEFKTICLSNDDYLKTFVGSTKDIKLNLREIIVKKACLGIKSEEENVCRFCLNFFEINLFTKLGNFEDDVFMKDMLEKCLPEMNLNMTENPLMCNNCMELLQNQFNFITSCTDNEENINYFHSENVSLYDIVEQIKGIKKEPANVKTEYIKSEQIDEYTTDNLAKIEQEEFYFEIEVNIKEECNEMLSKSICPPNEQDEGKNKPFDTNSEKLYYCSVCPYWTDRRADLEKHNITHKEPSQVQLYKCETCDFVTKWKGDVFVHNLRHINPSEVKMHKCTKCPYQTKYKQHLTRHENQRHKNEKNYKCTDCEYKTYERWILRNHYRIKHGLNVEPEIILKYSCRRCDYVGESKQCLEQHKKAHHKRDRTIKTRRCEYCGYMGNSSSNMKDHAKKHMSFDEVEETYTCNDCGLRTKYKNSLIKHFNVHKKKETEKQKKRKMKQK